MRDASKRMALHRGASMLPPVCHRIADEAWPVELVSRLHATQRLRHRVFLCNLPWHKPAPHRHVEPLPMNMFDHLRPVRHEGLGHFPETKTLRALTGGDAHQGLSGEAIARAKKSMAHSETQKHHQTWHMRQAAVPWERPMCGCTQARICSAHATACNTCRYTRRHANRSRNKAFAHAIASALVCNTDRHVSRRQLLVVSRRHGLRECGTKDRLQHTRLRSDCARSLPMNIHPAAPMAPWRCSGRSRKALAQQAEVTIQPRRLVAHTRDSGSP